MPWVVRTVTGDLHTFAQLAGLAIDLDTVVEELFEIRSVENTISSRLRVVNDEFVLCSNSLSGGGLGLVKRRNASV